MHVSILSEPHPPSFSHEIRNRNILGALPPLSLGMYVINGRTLSFYSITKNRKRLEVKKKRYDEIRTTTWITTLMITYYWPMNVYVLFQVKNLSFQYIVQCI